MYTHTNSVISTVAGTIDWIYFVFLSLIFETAPTNAYCREVHTILEVFNSMI